MAEKKTEAKEAKTNSRGEPIFEAEPKRLRFLQSVFGKVSGAARYEEEKKAGKELYA